MRFLLCVLLAALPASAANYAFEFSPQSTAIHFTLAASLHTVHGEFKLKHGAVSLNTETGKASGEIIVDVTSGETGNDSRDSKMHAEVLESKKYPEAVFTPDRVEGALPNLKVHGVLKIHGAMHEITMDVAAAGIPERTHAVIRFEIPFVAWGMKDPGNFLLRTAKVVQMTIEAKPI